jgi:uncharacterized protein
MENFTPVCGLVGGLLIGLAVALLLVLNGRIGGISGIVGGLLAFGAGRRLARGVRRRPGARRPCLRALGGRSFPRRGPSLPVVVVGGLLVGFGTRLGSGCTSGHGLCDLARFSRRSVVATAVFFCVAMVTVFFTRHVL